jgi:membrane associated rhomboid family serine protease
VARVSDPRLAGSGVGPSVGSPVASARRALGDAPEGVRGVGVLLAVQWVSEIADTVVRHRLDRLGVEPHTLRGLRGIVFAPFLHAGFGHLLANTVPFGVLGLLIALSGLRRLLGVTAIVTVISGLGMWLLGGTGSVHLGASGVVFGYLTYLLARGFFARRLGQIALGVLVGVVYGGLLWGVLPTDRAVSWQGHLFGAIGGVAAAWALDRRRADTSS